MHYCLSFVLECTFLYSINKAHDSMFIYLSPVYPSVYLSLSVYPYKCFPVCKQATSSSVLMRPKSSALIRNPTCSSTSEHYTQNEASCFILIRTLALVVSLLLFNPQLCNCVISFPNINKGLNVRLNSGTPPPPLCLSDHIFTEFSVFDGCV